MSSQERRSTVDAVAGLLAAASCALSLLAMVDRPVRFASVAAILAIVSARLSPRWERLALAALVLSIIGWVVGMSMAVITDNSIY
jgi:hypothetical protein